MSRRGTRFLEADRTAQIAHNPMLATVLPPLSSYPIPATIPFFVGMTAADDGALWVHEYPQPSDGFGGTFGSDSDEPLRHLVFGPTGQLKKIVLVRPGTIIHAVKGRSVLTSRVDEAGVPVVEIYALPP